MIGLRVYEINSAYAAAIARIDRLRSVPAPDPSSPSATSLDGVRSDLYDLRGQLERLDAATSLPFGDGLVAQLPWIGVRYTAVRGTLQLGLLSCSVGLVLTELGSDVVQSRGTWLDALALHVGELTAMTRDIQSIQRIRSTIDMNVMPDRLRTRLREFDRMLDRPEVQTLAAVDLSAALTALGGSMPMTYLVVFQNPAELRPSGGFPGTMALVTADHGQLASYHFFDAHELTDAYVTYRRTLLPQPWPLQRFMPQNGFLLHDALWWADFPRSAQQLMSMYAETGWPAIDGVIAVQPEVASLLVGMTGSFTIEFQGVEHRITPENVYSQIDQARVRDVQTHEDLLVHKELLGLIGQNIVERLKSANRQTLIDAIEQLSAACQRRDIQVYVVDAAVEAELDRRHCTGRLLPVDGQPTLAVTYANLALSKTSLDMRPKLTLTADSASGGERHMQLDIDLRDGAIAAEDPTYAGFQRWWVAVQLPLGSVLLSDRGPIEDPQAPNGGSYLADLFPDQTGRISLRFAMPDSPSLLIRRQPGVRPGDVMFTHVGCSTDPVFDAELTEDLLLDLTSPCR